MIQLEKENSSFNIYEQHFLIDSESELQTLENEYTCRQGDKAELPDGSYYLRHSDDYQGDLWELVKSSGGSGSGSSDLPPITSDDDGSFLVAKNGEWGKVGGYSVTETSNLIITEQTVTTVEMGGEFCGAVLTDILVGLNANDTVKVTYNNAEYILTVYAIDDAVAFGTDLFNEPFSDNIPFIIEGNNEMTYLITPTTQTATVKVEKIDFTTSVTDNFIEAVDKANTILASKVYIPKQTVTQTIEDMNGKALALADGISLSDVMNNGESIIVTVNDIQLQGTRIDNEFRWEYLSDEQSYWIGIDYLEGEYKLVFSAWDEINDCPAVGDFTVKGLELKQNIKGIPTIWFNYENSNWQVTVNDEQAIGQAIDDKTPIQAFAIENDSWMPANAIYLNNNGNLTCLFYRLNASRNDYFEVNIMTFELQNGNVVENSQTVQLAYFNGVR